MKCAIQVVGVGFSCDSNETICPQDKDNTAMLLMLHVRIAVYSSFPNHFEGTRQADSGGKESGAIVNGSNT